MRRNLAPGCISSKVKLCQRKPLFPFFRGPLFLGPLVFFFLFFLGIASIAKGLYFAASRLHAAFWTSNPSQDKVKCGRTSARSLRLGSSQKVARSATHGAHAMDSLLESQMQRTLHP